MLFKATSQQKLKSITIFYANSNALISQGYHAALLDLEKGVAVGFPHTKLPYHPVGGFESTESVAKSGFVEGSDLLGFKIRHCYQDVYTLDV